MTARHPIVAARLTLALTLALACSPAPTPPPASTEPPTAPTPPTPAPPPPIAADQVWTDTLDRGALAALQADHDLHLTAVLARRAALPGQPRPAASNPSLSVAYSDRPAYRALADAWTGDLERTIQGVVHRDLVTEHADAAAFRAGNVGRAFDVRWLRSPYASFHLIGVVNRLDRRDFVGGCGEIRLVYRLAYQMPSGEDRVGSRLPFVVNVVLGVDDDGEDCASVARRQVDAPSDPKEQAAWLASPEGPLAGASLRQVELNAQVVRWPAGFETEFGGQAIYLLTVTALEGEAQAPVAVARTLENTVDTARLLGDAKARDALAAWIAANLDDIDAGAYRIPEPFLATRALSYSTLGVNRRANKPFASLFMGDAAQALPSPSGAGRRFIGSRAGLIERLDNGSCSGCHQAGSTAGFQLLGEEDPAIDGVANRLQIGESPHLMGERPRRRDYVAAVANRETPDRFRPHSLAPWRPDPSYAASADHPCVPEGTAPHLASEAGWGCEEPFVCTVLADDPTVEVRFGQCVLPPGKSRAMTSGRSCRIGEIATRAPTGDPFNATAYKDRFVERQRYDLPEDKTFSDDAYNCRPALLGVPLGRTYRSCTASERTLTDVLGPPIAPELCAVVGGSRFDTCVEGNFHECLEGIVGRGMIDTCHADRPCREDYSCQALPWQLPGMPDAARAVAEAGVGFCTPTYFLFQLRLDGHPVPVPRVEAGAEGG